MSEKTNESGMVTIHRTALVEEWRWSLLKFYALGLANGAVFGGLAVWVWLKGWT